MPPDGLKQLLQEADATAPAPPLAEDLPATVRRRRSRRRQLRAAAATAAVVLVAALTALPSLRPSRQPQLVKIEPLTLARDLQDLELEAALHEQTAAHLLAAARAAPSVEPPAAVNPVLRDVRRQRDRAALILVYDADRAAREKQTDRAVAAYRRTIDLFPTTYWADVARRRLKEMPT